MVDPRDGRIWSPDRKLRVVLEAASREADLARICRREGVTPEDVDRWRRRLLESADRVFGPGLEKEPPSGKTEGDLEKRRAADSHRRKHFFQSRVRSLPDSIIFGVCEKFIRREGATEISRWLSGHGYPLTREQVYQLFQEGLHRGYLDLRPPKEKDLSERLGQKFSHGPSHIQVVNVEGESTIRHVADEAAKLTLSLIKSSRKIPLHIGFGAGNTLRMVARSLSDLLAHEPKIPHLVLHALGSGFAARDPSTSACTFFAFFDELAERGNIEYWTLMVDPFVKWSNFKKVKESEYFAEAFQQAGEIDIVITTLASAKEDPHGLLVRFMDLAPSWGLRRLKEAGWIGDVLWRPYSRTGPIEENTAIRVPTLFELRDLVDLARKPEKHVILVAGPCATCGKSKAEALRPLLIEPSLRVCNHLVTDLTTARELLENESPEPDAGR